MSSLVLTIHNFGVPNFDPYPGVEKHLADFGVDAESASHTQINQLSGGMKASRAFFERSDAGETPGFFIRKFGEFHGILWWFNGI